MVKKTPASPCTQGHPTSPAPCLVAPSPRVPCRLLRGVPPSPVPSPVALVAPPLSPACPCRPLPVPHHCPAPLRCSAPPAPPSSSPAPPPTGRWCPALALGAGATALVLHVRQRLLPRCLLAARLPLLLRPYRRTDPWGRPWRRLPERALGLRPLSPPSTPFSPLSCQVSLRVYSPRRPCLPFPSLARPPSPSGAHAAVSAPCRSRL